MTPLTILGAGSWGTALGLLVAHHGREVRLWDRAPQRVLQMQRDRVNEYYLPGIAFPDNLQVFHDLAESLRNITDILIVVPSAAFREMIKKIKPYVDVRQVRIAWGTKGLDATNQLLHEVIAEELGKSLPIAVF